ncbi:glycosyltransferase family 2 protein [Thermopirellula anaerolimosa]
MTLRPLVSVVIPVYNGGRFLEHTLNSVLAQTYRPIEIVAVDDGSSDDSCEVIRRTAPETRLIRQPNHSVGVARNRGVLESRGEYVCFLDQDDWWEAEKVERQAACFARPDVGLVHTAARYFADQDGTWRASPDETADPAELVGHCRERLLLGNAICNSSVMVRRALFAQTGLCSLKIRGNTVQDYDLWLRFAAVCEFAYIAEPMTVFRIHSAQGTNDRRGMLREQTAMLERVLRGEPASTRRAIRKRMAELYDLLGSFDLDDHDAAAARAAFRRSLRWRIRLRSLALWAVTFLPGSGVDGIRRIHYRLKGMRQ